VSYSYTDFAEIDVKPEGLFVRETAPGSDNCLLPRSTASKLHLY